VRTRVAHARERFCGGDTGTQGASRGAAITSRNSLPFVLVNVRPGWFHQRSLPSCHHEWQVSIPRRVPFDPPAYGAIDSLAFRKINAPD